MVERHFIMEPSPVRDRNGEIIGYRVGGTSYLFDRSDIFLGSIMAALTKRAKELGTRLEEEHLQDDTIESIVHEDLHVAINEATEALGMGKLGTLEEEKAVDSISQWVVEDIRQRPRLVRPGTSVDIKREVVSGRAIVRRRPVNVRGHVRRRVVNHLRHPPRSCLCHRSEARPASFATMRRRPVSVRRHVRRRAK